MLMEPSPPTHVLNPHINQVSSDISDSFATQLSEPKIRIYDPVNGAIFLPLSNTESQSQYKQQNVVFISHRNCFN